MSLSGFWKIRRRRIRLRGKPLALKCSSKWVLCIKITFRRSVVLRSKLVTFKAKSKQRSTDGKIRILHFKTRPTIWKRRFKIFRGFKRKSSLNSQKQIRTFFAKSKFLRTSSLKLKRSILKTSNCLRGTFFSKNKTTSSFHLTRRSAKSICKSTKKWSKRIWRSWRRKISSCLNRGWGLFQWRGIIATWATSCNLLWCRTQRGSFLVAKWAEGRRDVGTNPPDLSWTCLTLQE